MKKRVAIHSTAYGACSCGHAWITLDKKVIANFCTMAFWNTQPKYDNEKNKFVVGDKINAENKKYDTLENTYGELSRQDVYKSCWEYIHNLSIDEAITSEDPLIQSLAMIDKRLGKRRLIYIETENLHPLAKRLLKERIAMEQEKYKNFTSTLSIDK